MLASSLEERFKSLENDLLADPPRISSYADLPFAMLVYEPHEQWQARREMRLLANRLRQHNRDVEMISLGDLFWRSIRNTEGIEALTDLEHEWGFDTAQEQAALYLSDEEFHCTLTGNLEKELSKLDPKRHIVFLWRAEVLAPAIFHTSTLLDQMKGKTNIPTILFYPGEAQGKELSFMGLAMRHSSRNYRVKSYH